MRTFIAFVAAFAVPAGCGGARSDQAVTTGQPIEAEGRVIAVDLQRMVVDGDGVIVIGGDRRGRLVILVPSGERSCQARAHELIMALRPGDEVRVRGRATSATTELEVCEAGTYLKRI